MKYYSKLKAIPMILASLGASTSFAFDMGLLEEIIVTAQKRSESAQDVPIAISVLNTELLSAAGVNSFTDLGSVTPGLVSTEGSGSFLPYIRGIGTRTVVPGNDAPTAVYVDDVYLSDKTGFLLGGFNDVETIEILRGPQGTLFGRNSTAGAIRVATLKPSEDFMANAEATYGSDKINTKFYVTGGLVEGLSASLSGFYEETDEYIDNLNPTNGLGDEIGDSESKGVRGKISWLMSDNFSAILSVDYVDSEDSSRMAIQPITGTPLTTGEKGAIGLGFGALINGIRNERSYNGNAAPLVYNETFGSALTLTWNLETFDIKSITSYREDESGTRLDLDSTPLPITHFTADWFTDSIQQEFTFTSNNDSALSWVSGLYFLDQETGYSKQLVQVQLPWEYSFNPSAAPVPGMLTQTDLLTQLGEIAAGTRTNVLGIYAVDNPAVIDIQSIAAYGEIAYEFNNDTNVTVGLRYTDETHDLADDNRSDFIVDGENGFVTRVPITAESTCAANPACDKTEASFDELTWRLVLNHHFNEEIMGYASYNRGFKSGVYNVSTGSTSEPTEPEILDAYELGMKGKFLDGRMNLNAAVYYNDYSELQVVVTDTSGGGTQRVINAASAKISGMEVDMQWVASESLLIQAGFSTFFEAEYDEFPNCDVYDAGVQTGLVVVTTDCSGETLPVTPDFTAFVSPVYSVENAAGRFDFGGLFSYTDDYEYQPVSASTSVQPPKHEAKETINLFASWYTPSESYFAKLWVDNLTDQDDIQGLFSTTFGWQAVYYRGRTYGLTVGAKL